MWVQLVYLNIIRFFSGYAHIATFNLKKQTYAGHTAVLFDTRSAPSAKCEDRYTG